LNRRTGQNGNVFQQNQPTWNPQAPAYGRFWIDSPEGRKRRTITLGVCRTRSSAKHKLREYIETEGINSKETLIGAITPGTAFRDQAETWIASLPTRRRRPVKPATISIWQHALDKWILPCLGDRLLSDVGNGALKALVDAMAVGGLGPKTICNYTQIPKMVVASAVTKEGEQIYPRHWNHDFIGLPIVHKEQQHRPSFTEEEINQLLADSDALYKVLFALLAGSGIRIGEALALKASSFSGACRVLHVTRSIWHGHEQAPKTSTAVREVDLAEPLAAMLRAFIASTPVGYLFTTRSGKLLDPRNVLAILHRTKAVGFHAFRRFRAENLRRARTPEDLTGLWLGHARKTITDLYAGGLQQDISWRREWCDRVGLGFSLGPYWAINSSAPPGVQECVSIQ
jgi:integrase